MESEERMRLLGELREKAGAVAAAVITKDGSVVASDVAAGESRETLGVLCAAVLGAAGVASGELGLGKPVCIVVHTDAGRITIVDAGPRLLAMLAAPNGKEKQTLAEETRTIVARLEL